MNLNPSFKIINSQLCSTRAYNYLTTCTNQNILCVKSYNLKLIVCSASAWKILWQPILNHFLKKKTSACKLRRFISSMLLPKSKKGKIEGVPFEKSNLWNRWTLSNNAFCVCPVKALVIQLVQLVLKQVCITIWLFCCHSTSSQNNQLINESYWNYFIELSHRN